MWRITWERFQRSKLAVGALVYVGLITLIAIAAPLLSKYDPNGVNLIQRLMAPDSHHWFGTDDLGRDVLVRMMYGARVSLTIGFAATALALIVGSLLGAVAGYYGGVVDWLVSRVIEIVLCFPFLFLLLGIVALFNPSMTTILVALGLTSWTTEARFIRGEFLKVREMDFAQAARASGARDGRIIFRHLLPNALAPVLVSASFGVAHAILVESASRSSASASPCRWRRGEASSRSPRSSSTTPGGS
jgi:peptide/nickel transport system permease protein